MKEEEINLTKEESETWLKERAEFLGDICAMRINETIFPESLLNHVKYPRQRLLEEIVKTLKERI